MARRLLLLFTIIIALVPMSATAGDTSADSAYQEAENLYQYNRPREAMTLAQTALRQAEEQGDEELQIEINSLLSAIYQRLGMFEDALECLQICLDADTKSGDMENISSDLNNMAALFISLKQYDKAKHHIDRAIEIEKDLGRDAVLAIRYGIAGEVYMLLDMLPEAEDFARRAYDLDMRGGREGKAAIRQSQLASVLIKNGKLAEAKDILKQAMQTLQGEGNKYSYAICLNQLGDACMAQNNLTEAETYYAKALEAADENGFRYLKQRSLKGLWNALRNRSVTRAAGYLEQYAMLTDSLHNEATENRLSNLQAQFEYQQLQAENERLVYRNHISMLLWIAGIIVCLLVITVLSYILHAKNKGRIIKRQGDVVLELIEGKAGKTQVKQASENRENVTSGLSEKDTDFLDRFVNYVGQCLLEGQPVDAALCASHLCLSPRHLSRKVMTITGSTPTAYINRIKINRAKRLLETHPDLNITEVSVKCGFEDSAYFSKVFRQAEGISPTQYRNVGK